MKKKTDRGGGHPELGTGRSREIRMDRNTMSRRQKQKEKAMEGQVERPCQRDRKRDQGHKDARIRMMNCTGGGRRGRQPDEDMGSPSQDS